MSASKKIDLVQLVKQGNRWEALITAKCDDNVKTTGASPHGSLISSDPSPTLASGEVSMVL
jgi:hypothetical protein